MSLLLFGASVPANPNQPTVTFGTGSPQNKVAAPKGSLYLRTDGGTSTTLYVKTSGSGKSGWSAK